MLCEQKWLFCPCGTMKLEKCSQKPCRVIKAQHGRQIPWNPMVLCVKTCLLNVPEQFLVFCATVILRHSLTKIQVISALINKEKSILVTAQKTSLPYLVVMDFVLLQMCWYIFATNKISSLNCICKILAGVKTSRIHTETAATRKYEPKKTSSCSCRDESEITFKIPWLVCKLCISLLHVPAVVVHLAWQKGVCHGRATFDNIYFSE